MFLFISYVLHLKKSDDLRLVDTRTYFSSDSGSFPDTSTRLVSLARGKPPASSKHATLLDGVFCI